MEIVINIPDKEFGIDINDKFKDFFSRLKVEIKEHLITNTSLVCGAYELETIDMFLKAFNDSTPLPKGHGRLIDADALIFNADYYEPLISKRDFDFAPTIIDADKEVEDGRTG